MGRDRNGLFCRGLLRIKSHEHVIRTGGGDGTVAILQFHVGAALDEAVLALVELVLLVGKRSETPFVGHNNVLATSELVRSATE